MRFINLLCIYLMFVTAANAQLQDKDMVAFSPKAKQKVALYWKDGNGSTIASLGRLNTMLAGQHKRLIFAMNGGMYKEDRSPLGLFIQNGKTINRLNKANGSGNFYLQPNGVFYLNKNGKGFVCATTKFIANSNVLYATQSGPMLVIDGNIHKSFTKGSVNIHIRNGVGILPNGDMLFAMSRHPVNLYDFALYFKDKGCKQALYLDGFVSRTWYPADNWKQGDGNFGVIIGVTE